MAEESLKAKTVKGVAWSGVERFSVQGVQFLVMLVIARLLDPKDFGLVGMLAIFIAVAQSLIDSGFSQALIRKQNRTETDNCTVFYFNVVISVVLYLILYVSATWVADFYNEPQLRDLMRVLCVVVIVNSFGVVQRAIYSAIIDFKTQAKATFTAALVSGVTGMLMAYYGYGAWALVWQQLLNAGISTLLLWIFSSWRPHWLYSWKSFRELFSFGSKLLASGLLDTVYSNMYSLVIGKVFTASNLGQYTQAKNFTLLPCSNITGIIQRVTYPVLCTIQNDEEALRKDYRQLLRLSAFVVFPLMCLLAGIAHPLVKVLIGGKWDLAADMMVPLSLSMMWFPIHAINLNLLQVKGRSDLFLRLEIIKKAVGVSVLLLSIPFGLMFMCWSSIVSSFISLFINTFYTGKLIHVGFFMQLRDLSGTLLTSLGMYGLVSAMQLFLEDNLMIIALCPLFGLLFFIVVSWLFRFKEIEYLKSIIKR